MFIIAYDLGTGGLKTTLYRQDMSPVIEIFAEYATSYPGPGMHEQYLSDWWRALCESTKNVLAQSGIAQNRIAGAALSGASLVAVPLDRSGTVLADRVPIWSDTRAQAQASLFFREVSEEAWYMTTGNGFPPANYSLFKLMWMKENQPDVFGRTARVLGSKDYINYLLTGNIATDFSYASGTGAYNLQKGTMETEFLKAAGLPADIFPEPRPSHEIVGCVTREASLQTGLPEGIPVMCGGVDNACMALGAVGADEGSAYVSLGSSAWVPLNSLKPVLDFKTRPYVFAHIQEGMFTSAYSLFAGGNSFRWVRDTLFSELPKEDAYRTLDRMAASVPPGSNGVLFHPGLAGGTMQDLSPHLRGAFMGLHLGTTNSDLVRAAMEGVAMNLSLSLRLLRAKAEVAEPLLFCGGGSRSAVWMQIFADILNMSIKKTNIDQSAASLGAAAIAAKGIGWWQDYSAVPALHETQCIYHPDAANAAQYRRLSPLFERVCEMVAELGEMARPDKETEGKQHDQ